MYMASQFAHEPQGNLPEVANRLRTFSLVLIVVVNVNILVSGSGWRPPSKKEIGKRKGRHPRQGWRPFVFL